MIRAANLFIVLFWLVLAATQAANAAGSEKLWVLNPIERIAFSNDWQRETTRVLRRGAHVFVLLKLGGDPCTAIESDGSEVQYYTAYPTKIETPSSVGSRTGTYFEALIPRNSESCRLSRYVLAEWLPTQPGRIIFRSDGSEVRVKIAFKGSFSRPQRPFFVGSTNSYAIAGHCDKYCQREAEIGHKYATILSSHHVQPMQNWVSFPPIREGKLDLDAGAGQGQSFRDLVMQYSLSGLVGFPRARYYDDPVQYLRALETTIRAEGLVGRAWVYVADEPQDLLSLTQELALYRRHAPSVRTMVTTIYDPDLAPFIDIFAPVINWLGRSGRPDQEAYDDHDLWVYASCMESCGPNRAFEANRSRVPGPDTGLPDFLIDRPAKRLFRFFEELEERGVDAGFYYEATEGYRLLESGVNLFEDPWNFGGNGDGLLLYPGRPGMFGLKRHQPIATMRLKLIRHAIETYW